MFGRTKERDGTERADGDELTVDDFFGDEAAVEEATRVERLRRRVEQVEQQINSQFTSMAAYAQIAQEQIEMVRSEAQHATERSEQRVIGLIERERSDRLAGVSPASTTSPSPDGGVDPSITERLDALDAGLAELRGSLQQCLANQKALADAIIDLFQPGAPLPGSTAAMPSPAGQPVDAPPPPSPDASPAPASLGDAFGADLRDDPLAPGASPLGPDRSDGELAVEPSAADRPADHDVADQRDDRADDDRTSPDDVSLEAHDRHAHPEHADAEDHDDGEQRADAEPTRPSADLDTPPTYGDGDVVEGGGAPSLEVATRPHVPTFGARLSIPGLDGPIPGLALD